MMMTMAHPNGAKQGTSHVNLYEETGFQKLETRRKRQKLILFYKIQNGLTPTILQELITPTMAARTQYQPRSSQDLSLPKATTQSLQDSYFPSTTRAWNSLKREVREAGTLKNFKENVTPILEKPTDFYQHNHKNRRGEIIHTRIRLRRSDLKEELSDV